jgi:hypothetical protein
MQIYQLKYPTKEVAIKDLLQKGVYTEDLQFGKNIQAIVEIGLIVETPAVIEDMQIVTNAIYFDGYHFDIMTEDLIEFDYIVTPETPSHKFFGL